MQVYKDFYINQHLFTFFVEGDDNFKEMWSWLNHCGINYKREWSSRTRYGFSIPIIEEDSLLLFKLTWGLPLDFMKNR